MKPFVLTLVHTRQAAFDKIFVIKIPNSLVSIEQVVPAKKLFLMNFPKGPMFGYRHHLDWQVGSFDTILKGTHLVRIPLKFGFN